MKINEFIMVAGITGVVSAGGALSMYQPPCEINEKALKTIEDQNKRLSEQNNRLSDANKVIQDALSKLPDDQQKLVKLLEETDFKTKQLDKEIIRFQVETKKLEETPCKQPDKQSSLTTSNVLLGLNEKKSFP
jgi:DNA repair exonuclease SbcCD ATPase subunit